MPADLITAADRAVEEGKAHSRSDLVAVALHRLLEQMKRESIDAQFAEMANDSDYLAEAEAIEREFAPARWEAMQIGESDLVRIDNGLLIVLDLPGQN